MIDCLILAPRVPETNVEVFPERQVSRRAYGLRQYNKWESMSWLFVRRFF